MTGPKAEMSIWVRLKDELSDRWKILTGQVEGAQASWAGLGSVVGAVGKAFAAVGGAMALGNFFKASIEEAVEAEAVQRRLQQAVENTGGSFTGMLPEIDKAVGGLTRLTKYSDDDLKSALARTTTISGDAAGSIENLGLVADVASARQIDLSSAADLVGKAMNGNTAALKKMGIEVKDGESAVGAMQARFGGFAASEGQTFGGMLTRLSNGWKDFQEEVGNAIIGNDALRGSANKIVDVLADAAHWIEANSDVISDLVTWVVELGEDLWDLIKPVVDVGVALFETVSQLGLFRFAALGVQSIVIFLSGVFEGFGQVVKLAMGGIQEAIGVALQFVSPVLERLGIHVSQIGDRLRASGSKMVQDAVAQLDTLNARTADKFMAMLDTSEEHETKRVAIVKKGSEDRGRILDEDGERQSAAMKRQHDEIEKAEQQYQDVFAEKAPAYLQKAIDALLALNAVLVKSGKLSEEQVAQKRAERAELEKILVPLRALAALETDEKRLDLLENQAERLLATNALYRQATALVAQLPAHTEGWNAASAKQLELQKQVQATSAKVFGHAVASEEIGKATVATLALQAMAVTNLAQVTALVGTKTGKVATDVKETKDDLFNAARGGLALAEEFLGLDATSAKVLGNVLTIASTLKDGVGKMASGDIIGAVGAVAGILGSIFGGNSENKRILRENSERMRDLNTTLRLSAPGATVAGVTDVLRELGPAFGQAMQGQSPLDATTIFQETLFGLATKFGVTIADIDRVAKDAGIRIRNDDGLFLMGAVPQLLTQLARASNNSFGTSFEGRLAQLEAEFGVRGDVSAAEQLQRRAALFSSLSPAGASLGSADLSTTEGLNDALAFLVQLVPNIGNITQAQLGGLNRDQVLSESTRLAELIRQVLGDDQRPTTSPFGDTVITRGFADVGPSFSVADIAPALAAPAVDAMTATTEGVERVERVLLEIRDQLAASGRVQIGALQIEQNARLDEALDTILEAVDQGLAERSATRAFAQGSV